LVAQVNGGSAGSTVANRLMAATSSPTLAQSLRETPGSTSSFAVNDICTHAAAVAARYGQPGSAGHNRSRCLGRACRLRQCGSRRPLRVSGRPGCGICAGRQGICGGGAVPGPAQSDPGDGRPDDEPSRAGAGYGPAAWTYREETVPGAGLAIALCGLPKMLRGPVSCPAQFGGSARGYQRPADHALRSEPPVVRTHVSVRGGMARH